MRDHLRDHQYWCEGNAVHMDNAAQQAEQAHTVLKRSWLLVANGRTAAAADSACNAAPSTSSDVQVTSVEDCMCVSMRLQVRRQHLAGLPRELLRLPLVRSEAGELPRPLRDSPQHCAPICARSSAAMMPQSRLAFDQAATVTCVAWT